MNQIKRRSFLKTSVATAAALGLSTRSWAQVLGANDDIRIAIVGFNGQGRSHISALRELKGVRIVALCDADKNVLAKGAKEFQDRNETVETYADIRQLLANKNIDAISTATPNHWHALISIWACQAGKDVYVEKPACHNVWEGQRLIDAARKYRRMVQVGSQSRSTAVKIRAMQLLQQGVIGKVYMAKGLCYKLRPSIGRTPDTAVPPGVDWDVFRGPAPMCP